MARTLNDDLDRRLRAARPERAELDPAAFDAELLGHVRAQPRATPSRRARVPASVAATAALAGTAFVLLVGLPGDTGGPATAPAAIEQALHWFAPPAGSILHARSVSTTTGTDGQPTTVERETWQSADDPTRTRVLERTGATVVELTPGAIYDAATDTIYEAATTGKPAVGLTPTAPARKEAAGAAAPEAKPDVAKQDPPAASQQAEGDTVLKGASDPAQPGGDPVVAKVRSLLAAGRAVVRGRELHDGIDAWAITLPAGAERAPWTLWVAVADGRPIALHDPGYGAHGSPPEDARWTAYEVLPSTDAEALLTLTGAHPAARVVTDDAQYVAAMQRLAPSH